MERSFLCRVCYRDFSAVVWSSLDSCYGRKELTMRLETRLLLMPVFHLN